MAHRIDHSRVSKRAHFGARYSCEVVGACEMPSFRLHVSQCISRAACCGSRSLCVDQTDEEREGDSFSCECVDHRFVITRDQSAIIQVSLGTKGYDLQT